VDTTPPTVIANSDGEFSATFTVPPSSPEDQPVVVSQADNSASATFKVVSSFAPTGSSVSSFEASSNQSKITLFSTPSNQANGSVPVVTNNKSFDTVDSKDTIAFENKVPSTTRMNNTSPSVSTDNTINNNPATSASTQSNDTSNSKKSSEKSIPISPPTSNDQRTSTTLTKDNTTHEIAQNESTNPLSDAKVKNKDISSKDSETQDSQNSVSEKPSSVTDDKTITKVERSDKDNQPEKQSVSSDSIKRDRALYKNYSKYQESVKSQQKEDDQSRHMVPSQDIAEVNNRPIAINDKATTESNIPVNINVLRNDKDSDGDKLSIMGMSPPLKGKIETSSDGIITYTPLESWSGTERFGYTISDGRGGVATASVTVIVENQPPEAQDQDVTVNGNNPMKIKLEAKDPDDGKLRFVLDSKPSHGRIVQFSISTGTLTYVPDENYNGQDDFSFKVHDGTVFSKDAKVSIKIENNEKSSNDQVQRSDQHQKKDESNKAPTNEQTPGDQKSNSETPPNDSNQQSSSSSQDTEQQKNDQKAEEQQPIQSDKPTSDTPSGESQPNS
jgi:hypothetical protein